MNGDEPRGELAKWEYLRAAPARDARDPRLRELARDLWRVARGRPRLYCQLAHTLARDAIRYQTDTARVGGEEFGSPMRALERGVDDCDAKARLFVALCLAQHIKAEMMPLWRGTHLQHVYARVMLDGEWLPVELTLARARLGDPPLSIPKESETGQWLRT